MSLRGLKARGNPVYLSSASFKTGLISSTGVPSRASNGRTFMHPGSSISTISTRCRPTGFGRSGERVANTLLRGALGFPWGAPLKGRGGQGETS